MDSKESIPPAYSLAGLYDNPIPTRFLAPKSVEVGTYKVVFVLPLLRDSRSMYTPFTVHFYTCTVTFPPQHPPTL